MLGRGTQVLVKKLSAGELRVSWKCVDLDICEAVRLGRNGDQTRVECFLGISLASSGLLQVLPFLFVSLVEIYLNSPKSFL